MNLGPIDRPLAEILDHPIGKDLILVGGAAILARMERLGAQPQTTVIQIIPAARLTEDLDFLLSLDLFISRERGETVRAMLSELKYEPKDPFWQFQRDDHVVDFLARSREDRQDLTSTGYRVKSKPSIALHGRQTPEAFAAELGTQRIILDFEDKPRSVLLAHPYGLINMKVRAAHDRLQRQVAGEAPKRFSEKHGLDVYRLVASMTLEELLDAGAMAKECASHEIASAVRREAKALFDRPDSRSFREAQAQVNIELDHGAFRDALYEALGL